MTVGGGLRFEILGELRALRSGEPIDLGPAKQRAVLAVLLLQPGRPVLTHQIVYAVWGDEPPENGGNVVQKYVAGLRRALDPDDRAPRTPGGLLALTGAGYVVRTAEASVDADDFQTALAAADTHRRAGRPGEAAERLRAALALWRGDALAGLPGPVFGAARARLADAHASAWEKWSEIEISMGHHTVVIPNLGRLVEEFPLREGLRTQLMIALYQAGRQAEALAVFRDAREHFRKELGAELGEQMQEAHRRILRGEPFSAEPIDPWAGASSAAPSESKGSPVPLPPSPPPVAPAVYAAPPTVPYPPVVPPGFPPALTPAFPGRPGATVGGPFVGMPAAAPRSRPRMPIGEVLFAALVPLVTLGFGSWAYFVFAGARRHDRRQYAVAAAYGALLAVGFTLAMVGPDSLETDVTTTRQSIGFALWLIPPIISALHGTLIAVQQGQSRRDQLRREVAREFAAREPARARQLGVGRPMQPRDFSDGGLVDVNHAAAAELSLLPGIGPEPAQRIVVDRRDRGPFRTADELVQRGLMSARALHRLAPRLVCIAAGAPFPPSPFPPSPFPPSPLPPPQLPPPRRSF